MAAAAQGLLSLVQLCQVAAAYVVTEAKGQSHVE